MTLSSNAWQGGAADCTAKLYYISGTSRSTSGRSPSRRARRPLDYTNNPGDRSVIARDLPQTPSSFSGQPYGINAVSQACTVYKRRPKLTSPVSTARTFLT